MWVARASLLMLLALGAVGCVHGVASPLRPSLPEAEIIPGTVPLVRVGEPPGLRIADRAEQLVAGDGSLVRKDCSGLVETVFQDLRLRLPELDVPGNSVLREYRGFEAQGELVHGRPLPGDLAFFDDTWDRNHNGRLDDPLTHVAIVTSIDLDGTATLVHYGGKGLTHFKMNLAEEHVGQRAGKRYNDKLRWQDKHDPPGTRYLASELLAGLGRPAANAPTTIATR
jgi:hypothetical protein